MLNQIVAQPMTIPDPPPCTPESIAAAKLAADREREQASKHWRDDSAEAVVAALGMPIAVSDEQWRQVDGVEALSRLLDEHGADRVGRWLKNLLALKGLDSKSNGEAS